MKEIVEYDPNAKRPAKVQARLDALDHQRTGFMKVTLAGERIGEPIMTKACKHCSAACPMTMEGRFVCRSCLIVFF